MKTAAGSPFQKRLSKNETSTKRMFENGKDQILDFRELLEEDIRKSRRYILKKKFFRTVEGVVICILAAGLAGFLFYAVTQLL